MLNEDQQHPTQPIGFSANDVIRFKANGIVRFLVDHSSTDLNKLWLMLHQKQFTVEDMVQLYQLIGYSVHGFGEVFNKQEEKWDKDGKHYTLVPEKGYERAVALVEQFDAEAEKLWRAKQEFASGTNAEDDCG